MYKLLIILTLFVLSHAKLVRIPIYKQETFILKENHIKAEKLQLQAKYQISRTGDSFDLDSQDWHAYNRPYYVDISIGTPGQHFRLFFDTAFAELWIAGASNHHKFNASKSSTFKTKDDIDLMTYEKRTNLMGAYAQDTVTLGEGLITLRNQQFITIQQIPIDFPFDGIFGLDFGNENSPLRQLLQEKSIEEPIFSLLLRENSSSFLLMGGLDTQLYSGNMTYVPCTRTIASRNQSWQFTLDSLHIKDKHRCRNCQVIIDSSTSLIMVPRSVYRMINSQIGAQDNGDGEAFVDCEHLRSMPDVNFAMGNKDFKLSPKDFIMELSIDGDGGSNCMSRFSTTSNLDMIILGEVFLRRYYTVFDAATQQIGFSEFVSVA